MGGVHFGTGVSVLRVHLALLVARFSQRLQAAPLSAVSPLLLLPLRECGLRLLPAGARPRWINQLHPQERLALPSDLAEHLLGSQHKARIVR